MGKHSNIQWTDTTWNVAVGCSKVDSDCKYCYMYRDSLKGTRYDPKVVRKTKTVFDLPLRIKEPAKIFTSSLTDLFHPGIDSFRDEVWDIIRRCPQHTFQILTKRPERILDHLPDDWGDGWDNVWLGTSIGHEDAMPRWKDIVAAPAQIRFISFEPLWGNVGEALFHMSAEELRQVQWVIVGGESGNETGQYRYRPCTARWIYDVLWIFQHHGIPVFIKQLGTYLAKEFRLKDRHGGDITEWPGPLPCRRPYTGSHE